ncbi:MFS transporter [Elizabethkingia miricola]|uniref:MFS transporter n=1 Tax=Elizabethkingia miricola TaxID=172045 RepID=A0ABD4DKB3_ELIMR|nr:MULTISPECIES: MFS transporter [Elizabethkingia]KUY17312.1 MFS transporter [Elizabethkingia miricola]MCL1654397.1 MFS transporter [Elizabethkingia miricola]OPC72141.1 MFS transporter [Elizabethkingia miricola]OPC75883.1 MFS transporter [Elizabethkingia miricola]QCO47860.1 MFS transporter [Elizabethkingia sp. 2-6]
MNTHSKRWQALGFLVAGAFLSPLDYFIVNMALPAIQKAFNATDQQLQLVVAIYGLTYAALVVCGGRLGDIYGRKRIFTIGLYIFLFSSIACAFSPDISTLITARLFQGVGASLLAPQVLASVRVLFSSTEQPKAVSIFSSVFGLASVAGQLLGGLLLNLHWAGFSWEMVFLVNVPVTIVCIIGIHFTMDNNKDLKLSGIDYKGALLLILALLLFICSLIFGREYHWAWWIFVIMITGLVLAIVFFRYEVKLYRQNRPVLIDPTLLVDKRFSLSLPVIFFYNFTAGLFICYPYYLQQFLHYLPMSTGLAIVPYGLAFFLGPLISQRVKIPVNTLIYIGLGLLIIGFSTSSILFYLWQKPSLATNITLFLAGLGHGVIMPVMMRTAIALVSKDRAGQASALVSISMQVGGVTGGAIIGTVFFSTIDILSFPKAFALAILMIALFQITGVYINTRLTKYIINNND